jgi:glucose/mannose-6-phosphate isomerase
LAEATSNVNHIESHSARQTLDDLDRHKRLDADNMHREIASFPKQLRDAIGLVDDLDWSRTRPTTPAGICFCGMGGSAIGGDLARSYWEHLSPVPFLVVRNYQLPMFINEHWSVIVSSYSGNTEETLAALADASSRRCRQVVALASGGRLAEMTAEHQWPLVRLPGGLLPRASLGYTFAATMLALAHWGVAGNNPAQMTKQIAASISDGAAFLEPWSARFDRQNPFDNNPAKAAAAALAGRLVIVMGVAGSSDVVALRLKSQLNENSKTLSFASVLPEANHNEIVGLDALGARADLATVVVLSLATEFPPVAAQQQAFMQRLARRGIPLLHFAAEGKNHLQRLLYLVHLGDFISYHLAILNGVDPSPIAAIEELKQSLKRPQ